MWINRTTFEHLLTRVHIAESLTAEIRQKSAVQQQNFDWLANHVNRLEIERSTLLARVLGVSLMAPQIAREDSPPPPRAWMGEPLTAESRPEGEAPGMALTAMQTGSFDDMGDEAARTFGVQHDPVTGAVVYTR
jgi:hypothetical protein